MKKQSAFLFVLFGFSFAGILTAQEADPADDHLPETESTITITDTDNPGMGLLDQATEAKLRASTILDLGQVIVLCQRAKKSGLAGENLKYCNQLLASSHLQRGLFLAQQILNNRTRPKDWEAIRLKTLADLEAAVTTIKDQPTAYLRIAQLNTMPDGDEDRAKEALRLAVQYSKDTPEIQIEAVRLQAKLEPDPAKREQILAAAAKSGNSQIVLLHLLTLFELKRNDEAIAGLKKLIESEKGDSELQHRIVGVLVSFGEYESAQKILDSLYEKGTDDQKDDINLKRAELFEKMEQYEKALPLLDTLRKKHPNDGVILILRSDVHLAMENYEDALKDIEAAQREHPNPPQVLPILEQKFRILMEQEAFKDALSVVKELQSINPEENENQLLEIRVLAAQEKYAEAVEIVKKFRDKQPDNPQWTPLLIGLYVQQKTYDKALTLLEELLKKQPDNLQWIVTKTEIFTAQKKWNDAVSWIESNLAQKPESKELELLLISVFADKKSYKEAKERLKPLLDKEPENLALLRLNSQLSISLHFHTEAVRTLKAVIEAAPNDTMSLNNLSWLLSTSPIDTVRNGELSLELAEKACKLTQYKKAYILSTLAAAYAELGNFDKAREWSQKSIDLAKAKREKDKTEEEHAELLKELGKELDSYKNNLPYREYPDEKK